MLVSKYSNPEQSIYYQSAIILKVMKSCPSKFISPMELYSYIKFTGSNLSISQYLFALDWLYLLDVMNINNDGMLKLCI